MPFELIHGAIGIVFLMIWAYIGRIVLKDQCQQCRTQRESALSDRRHPAVLSTLRWDPPHTADRIHAPFRQPTHNPLEQESYGR